MSKPKHNDQDWRLQRHETCVIVGQFFILFISLSLSSAIRNEKQKLRHFTVPAVKMSISCACHTVQMQTQTKSCHLIELCESVTVVIYGFAEDHPLRASQDRKKWSSVVSRPRPGLETDVNRRGIKYFWCFALLCVHIWVLVMLSLRVLALAFRVHKYYFFSTVLHLNVIKSVWNKPGSIARIQYSVTLCSINVLFDYGCTGHWSKVLKIRLFFSLT